MCKLQGALVVGEGIETAEELKALISCGVHYGQGYLLAKPSFPIPPITWPPSS
jgi:EAL domain-containing protein (putative c-di-GMP-specific phosphodiesterase class I)